MAQPLAIPLPPGFELSGGWTVSVTALDPTTGSVVNGVNVSDVTIEVEVTSGSPEDLQQEPWLLVTGPRG